MKAILLSQDRCLKDYANKRGFIVDEVVVITEPSGKQSRKDFKNILVQLRESKKTVALIVDAIVDVQHYYRELVVLEELRKEGRVEIHFVREGLILGRNSTPTQLLRWEMGVLYARSMS